MLGSTRAVTNPSGAIVECYDHLPFGRLLSSTDNGRNIGCHPPNPDYQLNSALPQQFTGKERDEIGLDYLGARYMSAAQGRFTSPDPLLNSGRPWNPQSWNRYAYVLNNPLKFADPNGLYELHNECAEDDRRCNRQFNDYAKRLRDSLSNLQGRLKDVKDPIQRGRLEGALKALGSEGDGNGVFVRFAPLAGDVAGDTRPFDAGGGNMNYMVTFDPAKMSSRNVQAIHAAHEGTHIADIGDPRYNNPATTLSDFSLEYRAYQTSAWAAEWR